MKSLSLITLILIISFFSSCTRYEFVYLNSNLPKNDKKEFIQETDSLTVTYSFAGENCPLTIDVFNKLSIPLFVDWKKSGVVVNNQNISLWDDQESNEPNHISLVAPQSSVKISPLNMVSQFIDLLPNEKVLNVRYMTDNGFLKAKRHCYNFDETPFYFRCFISYSIHEDFEKEQNSDNTFWVSDIVPTYSKLYLNEPDIFYLQKSTAFSTFVGVTALAGLIVLGASMPDTGE